MRRILTLLGLIILIGPSTISCSADEVDSMTIDDTAVGSDNIDDEAADSGLLRLVAIDAENLDGSERVDFEYEYNENGFMTVQRLLDDADFLVVKWEYFYSGGNRLDSIHLDGALRQDYQYSEGRILSSRRYEATGVFTHNYEYNTLGQLIKEKIFNPTGGLICEDTFEYDGGNLSIWNSECLNKQFTYTYDGKVNPFFDVFPASIIAIMKESPQNPRTRYDAVNDVLTEYSYLYILETDRPTQSFFNDQFGMEVKYRYFYETLE